MLLSMKCKVSEKFLIVNKLQKKLSSKTEANGLAYNYYYDKALIFYNYAVF